MDLKRKLLIIALIFSSVARSQDAQKKSSYSSFGIQFYEGTTIGITYNRIRDSRPYQGEMYYQRQFNPGSAWNNSKRLPQWGIGISATHSGTQYVGAIVCAYPFVKLPLYSLGNLQGNLRIGFGVGWVQKPYNKIDNPEDELISQKFNTHSSVQWQNEVRLNSQHFINTAVTFYHCSNAKTSIPNLGINIPSLSVGYRYAFNSETRKPGKTTDTLNRNIFYKIFVSGGVKQMQVPDSSYYFVKLLTGEISKQISYSSILSIGLFVTHDASVKTDPLVKQHGSIQTSQLALYGSYEYNIGRLVIPVQFGIFLYNSNAKLLESIGFRYKLSHNWMAQFLLKSHGHKADLMHFGVGYAFR